jgi:nucleoside-diphosphate-sugar epimerase
MGYVGPGVVRRLRDTYPEATLIGLDTGYFAHCLTGVDVLPEKRLDQQYFSDVRNVSPALLQEIDAIVHLAAISNDPMGNAFEQVTSEINYLSSVELSKKAKDAGVRSFVFASSCSVYGFAEGGPRTEQSELNPLTVYAKSKINTEREIEKLADKDFVVTSLRFATACGMSDRLRLDLVLNDFVAGAVASKKISILSDGTPWRPLIEVRDMARAIDWAISRELTQGGTFLAINAGSNEWNYQVKDLAQTVADVLPNIEVSINKDAQSDKRSYSVDFSLFKELAPNHQPKIDLITAITDLKNGLEMIDFQDNNFRDSRYMRLKVLTGLREKGLLNNKLEWQKE